jgi:hypothetical protein
MASIHIRATPQTVYEIVADVTRTPEFSPEIRACRWLDGVAGPAVGARFEAVNGMSGGRSWKNRPVVIAAEPGREFAFARTERFAGTLVWRYRFEPRDGGTDVEESYEVTRPISRFGWFIIGTIFGGKNRREDLRNGMQITLDRVKACAERETKVTRSSI